MTLGGLSRAGLRLHHGRRWLSAAALSVAVLALVWGFVIAGAGRAAAVGTGTGGDGAADGSSATWISLIPPTSRALSAREVGAASRSGPSESVWVSLIPPTSSAVAGNVPPSARGAGPAAGSADRASRGGGAPGTAELSSPSRQRTIASAESASRAVAAGRPAGSGVPNAVAAAGIGTLDSWLIGIVAAVLIGGAVVVAVAAIARRRLGRH